MKKDSLVIGIVGVVIFFCAFLFIFCANTFLMQIENNVDYKYLNGEIKAYGND